MTSSRNWEMWNYLGSTCTDSEMGKHFCPSWFWIPVNVHWDVRVNHSEGGGVILWRRTDIKLKEISRLIQRGNMQLWKPRVQQIFDIKWSIADFKVKRWCEEKTNSKMAAGCGNAICGEATDYDGFTITCLKQSIRALCKKGEDQDRNEDDI